MYNYILNLRSSPYYAFLLSSWANCISGVIITLVIKVYPVLTLILLSQHMVCLNSNCVKNNLKLCNDRNLHLLTTAVQNKINFFLINRYMIEEYKTGFTPNPDILCNRHIKFSPFLKHAQEHLNSEIIATGHYARTSFGEDMEYYNPQKGWTFLTTFWWIQINILTSRFILWTLWLVPTSLVLFPDYLWSTISMWLGHHYYFSFYF